MRKVALLMLVLVVSIGLIGCTSSETKPDDQSSPKTITIGVMPDYESTPFIIAARNGYFEEEGVKVKIEQFKSAKDRDAALQSGLLDGVVTDVVAVVFSNEGGVDLKIIARSDGDIKMLAGKDSGILKLDDLKERSIGLSINTVMEYTVDQMLATAGISPGDVDKIAIPALPNRLEMLQGNKVDAAVLPEPLAGLAITNGSRVLISTREMAEKPGVIAFTAQSIQQYPEKIAAVFKAYNRAVDYLQTEPPQNYIDYIVETQGFPAGAAANPELPAYQKAAAPDESIVADVVEWMQAKSLIKGNYVYQDLVNNEILR